MGSLTTESELEDAMNFVGDAFNLFGADSFAPVNGFLATWSSVAAGSTEYVPLCKFV